MVQGRRRDTGLGGVDYVPLWEARERAAELRKAAKEGRDPIVARKHAEAVPGSEQT